MNGGIHQLNGFVATANGLPHPRPQTHIKESQMVHSFDTSVVIKKIKISAEEVDTTLEIALVEVLFFLTYILCS